MNDNIILTDATTEDKDVASGGAQYTNSAETIQEDVVNELLDSYGPLHLYELMDKKTVRYIRDAILSAYSLQIELENTNRAKGNHLKPLHSLTGAMVAQIVVHTGDVRVMRGNAGATLIVKKYYRNQSTNWEYKWAGTWMLSKRVGGLSVMCLLDTNAFIILMFGKAVVRAVGAGAARNGDITILVGLRVLDVQLVVGHDVIARRRLLPFLDGFKILSLHSLVYDDVPVPVISRRRSSS